MNLENTADIFRYSTRIGDELYALKNIGQRPVDQIAGVSPFPEKGDLLHGGHIDALDLRTPMRLLSDASRAKLRMRI